MPNSVTFPLLSIACLIGVLAGLALAAKGARAAWTRTPLIAPAPSVRHPALRQGLAFVFYGVLFALPSVMVMAIIVSKFGVHALLHGPVAP